MLAKRRTCDYTLRVYFEDSGRNHLKTHRWLAVVFGALLSAMPLLAQNAPTNEGINPQDWSSYYYVNVPIEKIYPHRLGYVIIYRKGNTDMATLYVPIAWFTKSDGKGDIIDLNVDKTWPYFSVFYKDGKFDHIRLFLRKDFSHPSWGNLPQGTDIDSKFNIQELNPEY